MTTERLRAVIRLAPFGIAWQHIFSEVHTSPGNILATVVLRRHVALLGPEAGLAFSEEVARGLREPDGRLVIDYVRLNMQARRPA